MLLEDDETQTPARKTLKRCSRSSWLRNLLKYYPRPPCAPSLIKSRFFRILQFTHHLFTFLKFLICIHAGNPRGPPRVLAKTLRGQQRGGLAALKLTKLFGINDFPASKDSGKVLIIIIYCYLIIIIIRLAVNRGNQVEIEMKK